jgi:hypothetical protein
MYVLLEPSSFSISFARSRDISSDAMFANVQSASPHAYMFGWFMSLAHTHVSLPSLPTRPARDALLERVGDEREDLLVLVEQEHDAEVAEALVREARARDELQALDLPKVRGVAEHVDVQQLGDVRVPRVHVLLPERRADRRGLLLDQRALICDGLRRV